MLVLSRRVGERLLIGDDIEIVILDSRGDGVKIGIDAPRNIAIHRAEVLEAVKDADASAAAHQVDRTAALALLASPTGDDQESDPAAEK